jgi:putative ABC transport system substrate-binding protein
MRRRKVLPLLAGTVLTASLLAPAKVLGSAATVAVLMGGTPAAEAQRLDAFREALKGLGYVEGRTIHIEPHYGDGFPDRLGPVALQIVDRQPNAIVCVGSQETAAAQAATRTIPIVFLQIPDPVATGFAATLPRPGGNITGFTQMSSELESKRVELLHEIAPSVSRAAFLLNPGLSFLNPFADAEAAARVLGIALRRIEAATPAELDAALATIKASGEEGLLIQNDALFAAERSRITEFALTHRVPTVFGQRASVAQGGLASYGPDLIENARLAARYVDKILKGASPADLPVQRPTKFELIINLKTAKAIGITVPQSLLARADEVIE